MAQRIPDARAELPPRIRSLYRWMDKPRSVTETMERVHETLSGINRDIDALRHEQTMVESLLGFLTHHHMPNHMNEPVDTAAVKEVPTKERSGFIIELALELLENSKAEITPADVKEALEAKHYHLGVKYPTTVIGNVLARSNKFVRLGKNRFKQAGEEKIAAATD